MSFLEGLSPQWIEEQYNCWQKNPTTLTADWQFFFAGFELAQSRAGKPGPIQHKQSCLDCSLKLSGVQSIIYRYRDIGHLMACTDPLSACQISHPLLELANFGLDDSDLDTLFTTRRFFKESASLREILETLHDTYCRSIGVEFMYIQEPAERQWLIDRMEPVRNRSIPSAYERMQILRRLSEAAILESFLNGKFPAQKRFSLEGGESLIVFLDQVVNLSAFRSGAELLLGMAHRGRINVLANILGKPLANIFGEFSDNLEPAFVGEGDVKYHKGFSVDRVLPDERRLHMSLAFNPSHLEVVDPVVEGKSRACQDRIGSEGTRRVLPVLVHGDAAFSGQGIVAETLNLSQLEGYSTGGTIHVILNNQIGFTTLPADSRSTRYVTDVAKMLMVPIFHVHGEDPEAVAYVAGLALEYRQTFRRDVVVEIICYRRHGHNEGDEPSFTQPLMYERIRERPSVHRLYAERLQGEGVTPAELLEMEREITFRMESAFSEKPDPTVDAGFGAEWKGVSRNFEQVSVETRVAREALGSLMERMAALPDGFTPHPKVQAIYQRRLDAVRGGRGIDWGGAEALSIASLLDEGVLVRLSGQDSRRGTFNHRHAVLHDITNDATHTPLAAFGASDSSFQIYDSMLSENAVLGFEYGYASASPDSLVIWEAQFGDFANGAQVIIDQFVAGGEAKWDRSCGLVMLLPHGYEGQGSEHSSARIERFLSLCAEENMLVCYPSTPAQFFHLLRRQVKLPFRRPLVIFTPKSLLRHHACVSNLDELTSGGFLEVLQDDGDAERASTVLICSGKIFFELLEKRKTSGSDDVAIIRIEQLYPLRSELFESVVAPLKHVSDWRWVQEEPANMGAWRYLRQSLVELVGREIRYVGRPPAAAPAVGSHRQHTAEQDKLIAEAFQEA